jgi:glycosyltransferase involved in cell wall biosynthesis
MKLSKIGIVSTFPPTQCGIATYSTDIIENIKRQYSSVNIFQFELTSDQKATGSDRFVIRNENTDDYIKASEFINSSDIDLLDIQHEFKIYGKPDGENIHILLENVKKPIATTLHTVNFELPKSRENVFRKIIARSNTLFVFSEEAKKYICNKYNAEESKIIAIPHGVQAIPFRLPSEIRRRKNSSDGLIFISTGHMRETKGYEIAIKALNDLKNEIGNFHYYIIGANHPQNETAQHYRKNLVELVNEFDLKDRVSFINEYLPQKDLIEFIQSADICLLPYTRKEQSSSGVLALMIACGRPILTTPFQYANSQIDEKSGIVTETFLPVDFAKGIKSLIKRKSSWEEIMRYNHTLGQSWNWKSVIYQYFWGYERALRG